jgi:predicted nucleotidyltransferase
MRCPTLSELSQECPSWWNRSAGRVTLCLRSNEDEQMCATLPPTESIHQRYLAQIRAILTSVFKDKECAMYLFGSRAAGTHAAVSDFDIAILAAEDISGELSQAREMLELSNIPFMVDLVDLRAAPAALGRQVQERGILLWEN